MKPTNIYFDFEFIDDGHTLTPISVGMCTDDIPSVHLPGEFELAHFYNEYQFDPSRANDWVRQHVFPNLQAEAVGSYGNTRVEVARAIREWVAEACGDTEPRFVGYYPSYDWVLLCQHFGNMMQLPDGWPKRPICLRQLAEDVGIPRSDFPKPTGPEKEHHALEDAKWIRELDGFLHKRWERNSP